MNARKLVIIIYVNGSEFLNAFRQGSFLTPALTLNVQWRK